MRFSTVATATLCFFLVAAPGLRVHAQDDDDMGGKKPAKKTDDDKKKDDGDKKNEKGDEGDDDEGKPKKAQEKLPINPFAKAKKGDWSVALGKMKMDMGGNKMNQTMKFTVRVKDVDKDGATCTMKQEAKGGMGGGDKDHEATFPFKEMPTFQKFMDFSDRAGASNEKYVDWKVEDEKRTVGSKEINCKKISCKMKENGMNAKLTMWVSDETKGWGLIALTLKGDIGEGEMKGSIQMDLEVKAYGNGDTADFGKKPGDEKADEKGADKDDDSKKDDEKKDDQKKDKKKDKKDDDD